MACSPHFTIITLEKSRPSLGYAKGVELEIEIADMEEENGNIVIIDPNTIEHSEQGFDVVSYDPANNVLRVFECKSSGKYSLNNLMTLKNAWGEPVPEQIRNKTNKGDIDAAYDYAEKQRDNLFGDRVAKGILAQIPKDSPARDNIKDCIDNWRVEYFLVATDNVTLRKSITDKAEQSPSNNWK